MPNPQDLSSYNFESNPFTGLLGGGQEQPAPGGEQALPPAGGPAALPTGGPAALPEGGAAALLGGTPPQGALEQATAQAGQQVPGAQPEPTQFDKGATGGTTKFLLGSIQSLENYIKESTDRDEIMTARGIISLLTRLISKDQEKLSQE